MSFDISQLRLTVLLAGPRELGRLDSLTVTVRDDRPGRVEGSLLAGGPSADEIAAHV